MNVFGAYARYYDLLYSTKSYQEEVEFARTVLASSGHPAQKLLDLGCGTALHASIFAKLGCNVVGIDQSETMLRLAAKRVDALSSDVRDRVNLVLGDIRRARTGRLFDAVVSLFHVMSYQKTNQDLLESFATARAHLARGGLFFFDFWYGPAVLTERPETRERRFENEEVLITRLAEPTMRVNENRVDVRFTIRVVEKATQAEGLLHETHEMRYLFIPEVSDHLERTGFRLARASKWMESTEPGTDTWNVCVLAIAC